MSPEETMDLRARPPVLIAALVAAVTGCAAPTGDTSQASSLPVGQAPTAVSTLDLSVSPLILGAPIQVTVTGAEPGASVLLVRGAEIGFGPCLPQLGGNCLDIKRNTQVLTSAVADGQGVATIDTTLPGTAPVLSHFLQAVTTTTGSPTGQANESNVVLRTVTPPECTEDTLEDNDDETTAAALTAGTPLDLVACEGDEDWFEIEVPDGDSVEVSATFDNAEGDVDLQLFDTSGTELDSDVGLSPTDPVVAWRNNTGADATVRILADLVTDQYGTGGVPYLLEAEYIIPDPCVEDAGEEDDDAGSATTVLLGTNTTGTACEADPDWYAVDLASGDIAQFVVTAPFDDGDVNLYVYGPGLNLLGSSEGLGSFETFSVVAGSGGLHYAEVVLEEDDLYGGGNDYSLTATAATSAPCPYDQFEPNDDANTSAVPLTAGSYQGLGMCLSDGYDWYTVDALAGETVSVDLTFAHNDGDIDLYFFDAPVASTANAMNANFLARGYSSTNNESTTYTVPSDGTYYIGVRLFSDQGSIITGGNLYDMDITIQ